MAKVQVAAEYEIYQFGSALLILDWSIMADRLSEQWVDNQWSMKLGKFDEEGIKTDLSVGFF